MRLSALLLSITTATLSAFAALAPAHAEPTIAGGYYADQKLQSCGSVTYCTVDFAPIPAGKTLIITDAGCAVNTPSGISLVSAVLKAKDTGMFPVGRAAYFEPILTNPNGVRRYQMQLQTHFIVLAGQRPSVFLDASASFGGYSGNCAITGVLK